MANASGGGPRRTSRGETICSACSPGVRGPQYRVRGDVRARRLGELGASVDQTASDPTPASSLRDYQNSTPFSSYRVPHQRHKRLLANSSGASGTPEFPSQRASPCPSSGQTTAVGNSPTVSSAMACQESNASRSGSSQAWTKL